MMDEAYRAIYAIYAEYVETMVTTHPDCVEMWAAMRADPVVRRLGSGSLPMLEDALAAAQAKARFRRTAADVQPGGVAPATDLLRALGFDRD